MNLSLQVFQHREPYQVDYAVPPDDLFDLSVVPEAPVMVSVVLGSLVFRTVEGATGYRVYRRSAGPNFTQIGADVDASEDPEITFADAEVTAPAYYRVRAINATGFSPISNTLFLAAPDAPELDAPVAIEVNTVTSSGFHIEWAAVTDADSYELEIATDVGFTALVVGYDPLDTASAIFVNVTGLAAGTTYYARIRAVNSETTSANSSTVTVTTSP